MHSKRYIDVAAANGHICTAASDLDPRVCFQIIDPHGAFNARYRQVALAAVYLQIAIMRHIYDVIYRKRQTQEIFREIFCQLFLPKVIVRTNADNTRTHGTFVCNESSYLGKFGEVGVAYRLNLDLGSDLNLILRSTGHADRAFRGTGYGNSSAGSEIKF